MQAQARGRWRTIVYALTCAVAISCSKGPSGPSDRHPALTQVINSAHYVIRAAPGDSVDAGWQDAYFEWIVGALALDGMVMLLIFQH